MSQKTHSQNTNNNSKLEAHRYRLPPKEVKCKDPTHIKTLAKKATAPIEHFCLKPECRSNILMCTECQSESKHKCSEHPKARFSEYLQNVADSISYNLNENDNNLKDMGVVGKYLNKDKEPPYLQDSKVFREFMGETAIQLMQTVNAMTEDVVHHMIKTNSLVDDIAKKKMKHFLNITRLDATNEEIEEAIIALRDINAEEEGVIKNSKGNKASFIDGKREMMIVFRKEVNKILSEKAEELKRKLFALPDDSKSAEKDKEPKANLKQKQDNIIEEVGGDDDLPKPKPKTRQSQHFEVESKTTNKPSKKDSKKAKKSAKTRPEGIEESTGKKSKSQNNQKVTSQPKDSKTINAERMEEEKSSVDSSNFKKKNINKSQESSKEITYKTPTRGSKYPIVVTENPKPNPIPNDLAARADLLKPESNITSNNLPPTKVSLTSTIVTEVVPSPLIPNQNLPSTPTFHNPTTKLSPSIPSTFSQKTVASISKEVEPDFIIDDDTPEYIPYLRVEPRKKIKTEVEIALSSWNTSVSTNASTIDIQAVQLFKKLEDFECLGFTSFGENLFFKSPVSFEATNLNEINEKSSFTEIGVGKFPGTPYFTYMHAFKRNDKNLCLFSVPKEGETRLLELNGIEEIALEVPKQKIVCCDFSIHNIVVASTESGSLLIWHMNENQWQEIQINIKAHLIHILKGEDEGDNGNMTILLRDRNKFYSYRINFLNPNYNSAGNLPKFTAKENCEILKGEYISCVISSIHNPSHFYFARENEVFSMNLSLKKDPRKLFKLNSLNKIQQLLIVDCKQLHYLLVLDQGLGVMAKEDKDYSKLTTLCIEDNQAVMVGQPLKVNIEWANGKTQLQFVKNDSAGLNLMMVAKNHITVDENRMEPDNEHWLENMPIDLQI
jgi:hypothetical protein